MSQEVVRKMIKEYREMVKKMVQKSVLGGG